ncbi:glycoside hydrolase [Mycobacterium asiaticum]|uniref:Glycoside hydrolase n=1 Tax=Mycobacterium asiaticum TaxID=1790 RepID=A0A1A3PCH0_MYCAS|nr:glycoside hydrolase [Mycobacterium asiaticum]
MIALATLLALVNQVSGTPYISGGDSPAGTDCSGLASWVANAASDRPVFGSRFNTGNEEAALLSRGFQHGTAANAVVIGWNGGHTAVTLPDGTPVSSGEGGGVRIGGGGAYQPQFTHHMYLPIEDLDLPEGEFAPAPDGPVVLVDAVGQESAPPAPEMFPPAPEPAPELAPEPAPELAPEPAPPGDPEMADS